MMRRSSWFLRLSSRALLMSSMMPRSALSSTYSGAWLIGATFAIIWFVSSRFNLPARSLLWSTLAREQSKRCASCTPSISRLKKATFLL